MSRVFEALTRASAAKQPQPELSVEKIEGEGKNDIPGTILERKRYRRRHWRDIYQQNERYSS